MPIEEVNDVGVTNEKTNVLLLLPLLAFSLATLSCNLINSPDLEVIRESDRPESILFQWISQEANGVVRGDFGNWPIGEPCSFTIESFTFDLENSQAEEAFRSACADFEAIGDKYDNIEGFWEWKETNIFLREEWNNSSQLDRTRKNKDDCCEHLVHLLMWEDFSSEVNDVIATLRNALVCGTAKEYYIAGDNFRCRKKDSAPILTPTFEDAVAAVTAFLHDSAIYRPARCQFMKCEEELLAEAERDEQFIYGSLSEGRFENFSSNYSRRGEWRVLLVSSWPESQKELIECFKVLNKPGKYSVLKWHTKDRVSREIVDAGYPWVTHCGGISRIGQVYWRTRGSLPTRGMSVRN